MSRCKRTLDLVAWLAGRPAPAPGGGGLGETPPVERGPARARAKRKGASSAAKARPEHERAAPLEPAPVTRRASKARPKTALKDAGTIK